jgi:hypothetical protein
LLSFYVHLEDGDKDALKIASINITNDFFVSNMDYLMDYTYITEFTIGYFKENNNITVKVSAGNGDVNYCLEAYKKLIKIEVINEGDYAYSSDEEKKFREIKKDKNDKNANLLHLCKGGDILHIDNNIKLVVTDEKVVTVPEIVVFIDGKKYAECKFYMFNGTKMPSEYIYVDRLNKQFYFTGYEADEFSGILRYDIKKNEIEKIVKYSSPIMAPMRLPNTPYLMFGVREGEVEALFLNIYIKEIPEWKAEIEKQKENKKLHPTARKAFIDGPANIRDKPKGKNTATLDDLMEVLILNQENDWYEILYANVRGWTYKDNLKDIK